MPRLLALGLFVDVTTASIVAGAPESVGTLLGAGRLLLLTGRRCLPTLRCIPLVRNEKHIHSLIITPETHSRPGHPQLSSKSRRGQLRVATEAAGGSRGKLDRSRRRNEKIGPERRKAAAVSYAAPAPLVVVYGRLKRRAATGREEKPEPKSASSRVGMPPSR